MNLLRSVSVPDLTTRPDTSEQGRGSIRVREYLSRYAVLWLTLLAFALTILYINPLREVVWDDDFAYARTVRTLLETGNYQLDAWATANPVFQTYWGALFARLFGYSISTLRVSTLVLALVALVGIYALAREHGLNRTAAGIVMLTLLVSPIFVRFSFTFFTDVPFLALLILALFFYTRALRLKSIPSMLAGSVFAAAAILTRQLGVALMAGLFVIWLLDSHRFKHILFYLSGVLLPIAAVIWQASNIFGVASWGAKYSASAQAAYLAQPGTVLLNLLIRPAEMLIYLALFALPFVLFALIATVADLDRHRPWLPALFLTGLLLVPSALFGILISSQPRRWALLAAVGSALVLFCGWRLLAFTRKGGEESVRNKEVIRRDLVLLLLPSAYLSGVLAYRFLTANAAYGLSAARLYLFLPLVHWNFTELAYEALWERACITILCCLGAVLFARIFVLRYRRTDWRGIPPAERLLDWTTLFLFVLMLPFFQFGDRYMMVLLPFGLIVLGRYLQSWLTRYQVAACLVCLVVLIASAIWTRDVIAHEEALWRGAEYLREQGVAPNEITAFWAWNSYHGLFDDYLKEIGYAPLTDLEDYFNNWIPAWSNRTGYLVTDPGDRTKEKNRILVTQIPYSDAFFRERWIQVWRTQANENP